MLKFELRKSSASSIPHQMINDQDLGFISNFLGTFIPLLVTAYHYVIADLKCEGSSKDQAGTCCDRCLMVFSNEDRSGYDSDKHRVIE